MPGHLQSNRQGTKPRHEMLTSSDHGGKAHVVTRVTKFFPATRLETRWDNCPSVVARLHFYLQEETKASTKDELVGEFHS